MGTAGAAARTAVCTIISKNYLHYARTLMDSLRAAHPEWGQYVLLVDRLGGEFDPAAEPFTVLEVSELPLPDPAQFLFRYTILEVNTAVKPWLLEWLFEERGFDRVVYLDPDIYVYSRLADVESALGGGALMVLTPHLTEGLVDGLKPTEADILRAGCYNLGFIALGRHPQLSAFLHWWERNLEYDCRMDFAEGLFVDQKWIDLAPGLFDDVHVLKHPGYNVAYWNLGHRPVVRHADGYTVRDFPLVFFHFSGLDPERPHSLSRHQERFNFDDLGDARELIRGYCRAVKANGLHAFRNLPYAFGSFADGTPVLDRYRVDYRQHPAVQQRLGPDPFRTGSAYFAMLAQTPPTVLARLTRRLPGWGRLAGLATSRAGQGVRRAMRPVVRLFPHAVRHHVKVRLRHLLHGTRPAPAASFLDGLNIVGYVRSEHGIGESARLCGRAAEAAGVPFSMHDYNAGNNSRVADTRWEHKIRPYNVHWVNVFHVNADQMTLAYNTLGPPFFAGHYNIGFWHWELPEFPDAWAHAFGYLQEVWVPSQFVLEAVSRKSPRPVVRMPHAVKFRLTPGLGRSAFGLPEGAFLFLTMYDTHSVQARKNPQAVMEAFRMAFPHPRAVGLVVKVNNPASYPEEVAALKEGLRGVPGVVVLDRILGRQEVYDLEGVCDTFVSLHRSEGFGLGLAESMFLGKPAVGTGWSGNADFMTADNSCPVRYELVRLDRDYGPYPKGQVWAEPDLDHAAWCLKRLVEDGPWREALAARGRQTIREHFSPRAVGAMYRRRLRTIWETESEALARVCRGAA